MSSLSRINRSAVSELIVNRKAHIISLILLGISEISYINTNLYTSYSPDVYWLSISFFFFALVPLFFSCINVFKDMHDVPSADVQMAMPLSAKERFLSRILTICYIWVFPYLFFVFVGASLCICCNILEEYSNKPELLEMLQMNGKVFLWSFSAVIFTIGITVLCVCCIGSKAESIYIPVIMSTSFSLLIPITIEFVKQKFSNISINYYDLEYNFIGFGAMLYDMDDSSSILMVLLGCVISFLLILIALRAYVVRDAVTVGYPVVFKSFFEIVITSSLLVAFELAHNGNNGVSGIAIFIFFIASIILRIIVSRKDVTPVKIIKWTGLFAFYYALFIGFSYVACMTNGFSLSYKTPDFEKYDNIESYEIRMDLWPRNTYTSDINIKSDIVANTEKVLEIFNKYVEIQNNSPDFFKKIMFDGMYSDKDNHLTNCTIHIYMAKNGYYDNRLCSLDIWLSTEDISKLYRELGEISND